MYAKIFDPGSMKLQRVIFLVALLALQACNEKNEPEPAPETFLTVTLGADYYVDSDMWIFATDETGKVLDAGPIKTGSSVALQTLSPPELVNLTVYYNNGGTQMRHLFYTYGGINSGDEITLERTQPTNFLPPVAGNATINIQNCSPYADFNLSDGHAYSQFNSQANTAVNASFDLRQDASNILITSHMGMDRPVYGWVNDVTDAGSYTIDFNSLTPFPKNISVSFTGSTAAFIIGRKSDVGSTGYIMANHGFSTISADLALAKFGYLDGFDEYSVITSTAATMPDYYRNTYYLKDGTSLPEEITFPDNTLVIKDSNIGNFGFDYSSTYTYRGHYWIEEDATDHMIHWRMYTDKPTTPPITELPEAFMAKYPSISLNDLTYFQSEFFKHEDGYTYAQFLNDMFAGRTPEQREYFGVLFQPK